jgi:hypothetical protein
MQINKFFRPTFAEAHQHMMVDNHVNGTRLYASEYTWTNSADPGGASLVSLGNLDAKGADVISRKPGDSWDYRGVSLLCGVEELASVL